MGKKHRKRLKALEQHILTLDQRVLTLEHPVNPAEELAQQVLTTMWAPVTEWHPSSGVTIDVGNGYRIVGRVEQTP